jgi:hypothetical protein
VILSFLDDFYPSKSIYAQFLAKLTGFIPDSSGRVPGSVSQTKMDPGLRQDDAELKLWVVLRYL